MGTSWAILADDLRWLSGVLLGTVFLASGAGKLVNRARFHDTLDAMELFPRRLAGVVSWTLPVLEVVLACSVLSGRGLAVTGPALLGLLLAFLATLILFRLRGGKELACGCFADFGHKPATSTVILRDALLFVAGLPLLAPAGRPGPWRGAGDWALAATAVAGVITAWVLLARLAEALASLRAETRP
jgi:hypothetical protein